MKKRLIIFASILVLIAAAVFLIFHYGKNEEKTSTKPTTKKATSTTVLVVNPTHSFTSTNAVKFLTTNVDNLQNIDSNIRFILFPKEKTVSEKLLQELIAKKKVILFYGENVLPENVQKKIGLEFDYEGTTIQSSIPFTYVMFGYGYSKSAKGETIWFVQNNSNAQLEQNITQFFDNHSEEF